MRDSPSHYCKGHGTADRLVEILGEAGVPVAFSEVSKLRMWASGRDDCLFANGFALAEQSLTVITEQEFFGVSQSYLSPTQRKLAPRRGQQVDPLELSQATMSSTRFTGSEDSIGWCSAITAVRSGSTW